MICAFLVAHAFEAVIYEESEGLPGGVMFHTPPRMKAIRSESATAPASRKFF